jgi:NAD(P)-dependent dehydrogenase (short-subunit alcohol dehydrogenase family)
MTTQARDARPRTVTVYGAYGHTGRFVVAELCRRGWIPVLSGRDVRKLQALHADYPSLACRPASIDDPASLDRAMAGAAAVINCAGPFLDTAGPLVEAALRSRIAYLDITAEQQAVLDTFERHADEAHAAGITVLPGMAFYGGLADLLATAAMGEATQAEAIEIAIALDGWHPTDGTRRTGQRNHHPRQVVTSGRLDVLAQPAPLRDWRFAEPWGLQAMVELPFSETITISRHLHVQELHSYINRQALEDIRDPHTPAPVAVDAAGRSAQRFLMDVAVHRAGDVHRRSASGRDIYAITAPLVVEAMERVLDGRCRRIGVVAAGEAFDAADFLAALASTQLQLR